MMSCVSKRVLAFLGITAAVVGAPIVAQAAGAKCARPVERTALEMRVLQSELMVAALTCDYRADYNNFVTRFQPVLSKQGDALRTYFRRVYGAAAAKSLDSFVTQMANAASKLSREEGRRFCQDTHTALQTLSTMAIDGLPSFASNWPRASMHGQSVCSGKFLAEAEKEAKVAEATEPETKAEEPAAKSAARADWYMWQ
jgi:hypothetical protein